MTEISNFFRKTLIFDQKPHPMSVLPSSENPKHDLRKSALATRESLDMGAISAVIQENIESWPVFGKAETVLFYYPYRHEVDLLPLAAAHPEKRWYLPAVTGETQLSFFRYHPGAPLETGQYGIREPSRSEPLGDAPKGTLILIPGLMFDRQGYRLGYGKGYYDRFLSALTTPCQLAAPVPEALLCDQLPHDPWDVKIPALITEAGLFAP